MCDAELHVGVCDWQWAGGGFGALDVMYLLWTSVEPNVVHEHEAELLRYVCCTQSSSSSTDRCRLVKQKHSFA